MSKYQNKLKDYIKGTERKHHACMGCDMGDAGPGPQGKHDEDCFLLETQKEINKLNKDLKVMREIAIDMWAEDECFEHPGIDCKCLEQVDEEFKRRRRNK